MRIFICLSRISFVFDCSNILIYFSDSYAQIKLASVCLVRSNHKHHDYAHRPKPWLANCSNDFAAIPEIPFGAGWYEEYFLCRILSILQNLPFILPGKVCGRAWSSFMYLWYFFLGAFVGFLPYSATTTVSDQSVKKTFYLTVTGNSLQPF